MLTSDQPARSQRPPAVRWAVPGTAAVFGAGYLVAGVAGDNLAFGIGGLILMLLAGAAFMLMTRFSELAAGLADRTDERINSIDRDATLFAGAVLLLTVIAMFMIEIAQGRDGSPYYQLCALAGISYIGAVIWLRFRR